MATTKKKYKYNLADASGMVKALSTGDKSKMVDANNDGKMNQNDVSTMLKYATGWSQEDAEDIYKGKEVTPGQYGDTESYLLGKVVNREPFEFSGTDGPLYKAYAKRYKREGDLAAKDTLSKVSARTGGVPSSYAVTATAAQQNQYAGALADKIPELYEMEYNQYAADAERDRADLSTVSGMKSQALSDAYNAAGIGDYTALEELDVDTSTLKENDAFENALRKFQATGDLSGFTELGIDVSQILYDRQRDEADWKYQYGDLSGAEGLGVDTSYASKLQENDLRDSDMNYNITMYSTTGDLKYLEAMGVDTGYIKQGRDLDFALQAAGYGDYSYLNKMGIDTSKLVRDENWNRALAAAEYGDYSGLRKFGIDTSALEESRAWERAMNAANYGDFSGLDGLGVDTAYAKKAQNKSLYSGSSGSGSKSTSKYSSDDHSVASTKIALGPMYWDDSVKDYCRTMYGMEPIDVYYASAAEDGYSFYDVVVSVFGTLGIKQRVISPEEWAKGTNQLRDNIFRQWNATSYDDYLHKVAYANL